MGGRGRAKEREGKKGTKMTVHRVYLNPGNTACPVKTDSLESGISKDSNQHHRTFSSQT